MSLIKIIKFNIVLISVCAISGCSVSLTKSMEDYTGSDSARIRVKNYLPPLTLEVYEKSGQCFKLVSMNTLTAGVNVAGIKSTYNKKITGMRPPSPEMSGMDSLEYSIKANQHIRITYKEETFRSQYNQVIATRSKGFVPETGHDYDVYAVNSGVRVVDLTNSDGAPRYWGEDEKECQYKNGLLGQRNYY
ncbi:Uncharacterised protein [Yersinia mollaretii]|uniref:hypothetical protein n=1 Tax=Yersinia mollaretii TaxID=33060 RepID=UPI0005E195FE|nr:hypothetical protein [Yersinia mollaretii]CNK52852.1 Uncharacterised protein [Yersinia mollaretii]